MTHGAASDEAKISVKGLDMAYGDVVIQRGLDFDVRHGEIFIIMGGSGTGKSTLLKHMIGLKQPAAGDVYYDGAPLWQAEPAARAALMRQFGVLYQQGALWSSMTLLENVALPLKEYTPLTAHEIDDLAAFKLALVGLAGFEDFYPAAISGGMRKRAGLARAMALDPDILFFDEPSAGLDPISAKHLDDLILELRDSLGSTIVVVTHELASIFAIGDNSILLDGEAKTVIAGGNPRELLRTSSDERVRAFLSRGASESRTGAVGGEVS